MEKSVPARVLVVDDDGPSRELVATIVEADGVAAVTSGSAREALEILRGAPDIDLVVSDIRMPVTDGIEFLGQVRREFASRAWLQLILVTGHASVETAVAAMRLDACDYLFKPIDHRVLADVVRQALSRAESIRRVQGAAAGTAESEELERIAATARELVVEMKQAMSRGDSPRPVRRSRTAAPGSEASLRTLALLHKLVEARTTIFGDAVMPEPAWEMLGELMRAQLAGQKVSVTSLALASRSPTTTALRRIEDLMTSGLVERVPDPDDRRRTHVVLTAEGLTRMLVFLEGFARTVAETR